MPKKKDDDLDLRFDPREELGLDPKCTFDVHIGEDGVGPRGDDGPAPDDPDVIDLGQPPDYAYYSREDPTAYEVKPLGPKKELRKNSLRISSLTLLQMNLRMRNTRMDTMRIRSGESIRSMNTGKGFAKVAVRRISWSLTGRRCLLWKKLRHPGFTRRILRKRLLHPRNLPHQLSRPDGKSQCSFNGPTLTQVSMSLIKDGGL